MRWKYIYITLWQIYSGHCAANFIRISQVLQKVYILDDLTSYLMLCNEVRSRLQNC